MTCIAGLVDGDRVYIGADSAGISEWDLTIRADDKVFRNGDFLMGFTTSFRMGQLLRYAFHPPRQDPDVDVFAYLVTTFIDGVRECLKTGGYAVEQNKQESCGQFLVGYRGGLYTIESDYQVGQASDNQMAIGCGAAYALGVLFSTQGDPPGQRILRALMAAEHYSAGVRAPFKILDLAPND